MSGLCLALLFSDFNAGANHFPERNKPNQGKFMIKERMRKSMQIKGEALCSRNFQNVKLRFDFVEI